MITVCLTVYFNTFSNQLVWDDQDTITKNIYIRDYKNIPLFFTPYFWNELHPNPGQYRPLRTVSLSLDFRIWGLNPAGYHITNVLLHTFNVILVFCLVNIIVSKQNDGPGLKFLNLAFLTGLFFAIHPIHTESINFVKNRSDLLAFLFFLSSILLFIKALDATGCKRRGLLFLGAWALFIPAVFSKEMALTLPGVLALYVLCFHPAPGRKSALIHILPYGIIILGFFWFYLTFINPAGTPAPIGVYPHLLTIVKTAAIYFKMLLIPFPLIADREFNIPKALSSPDVIPSLLTILLVLAVFARSYRRSTIAFFAIGWILLTLTPAINLVYLVSRPIAEQRLYIPSLGFCLLLAYGIERISLRFRASGPAWPIVVCGVLAGTAIGLYSIITIHRNFEWQDELTFCAGSVAANPASIRMRYNLGNALSNAERYQAAIEQYQTALCMNPDYLEAHYNLGITYYETGQYDKAIRHYRAVLALAPDNIDAWNNMGVAFYDSGRLKEARACFEKTLKLAPNDIKARQNMKDVLVDLRRTGRIAGPFGNKELSKH